VRAVGEASIRGPRGPIGFTVIGSGPVVVLLAGLGSTARIWGGLPALMGRGATVITLDNRGVGASREGPPFALDLAADDLVRLLGHLRLLAAALLGVSMGGLVALAAALAAPGRVSRLAVASCAAHLSTHGRRSLELLRDMLAHLPPARVGGALMTLTFAPPFHERFPQVVAQAADLYGLDPGDLPGTRAQLDHLLSGWDLRSRLAGLYVPTLVLAGERDAMVAVEDTAELAACLPSAELLRVPDAGHSVLAEGGGALLDRVLRFLTASE
jgi:3-oxoadipate enol-lactonase